MMIYGLGRRVPVLRLPSGGGESKWAGRREEVWEWQPERSRWMCGGLELDAEEVRSLIKCCMKPLIF